MKSQKQLLPYILTFIMVCLMVGVSQWLNEPEIIFPEITALTIGSWLAPKQVWNLCNSWSTHGQIYRYFS